MSETQLTFKGTDFYTSVCRESVVFSLNARKTHGQLLPNPTMHFPRSLLILSYTCKTQDEAEAGGAVGVLGAVNLRQSW
jgi:hypothetical protein